MSMLEGFSSRAKTCADLRVPSRVRTPWQGFPFFGGRLRPESLIGTSLCVPSASSWQCSMLPVGTPLPAPAVVDKKRRKLAPELSPDVLRDPLLPGHRLLVIFSDDPGYFHELIVRAEVFPGSYSIATSVGHKYVEESKHWVKVWLMTGTDGDPVGLEGEMMAFEDVWSDSKMLIFVKRMRELALTERASKPAEAIGKDFTTLLGWEGESHDLAPRMAIDGLKKRLWPGKHPGPPPLDAPAGLPAKVPEAPRPPEIDIPAVSPEIPRDTDLSAGPGFTWVVCEVFGDPGPYPVNFGVTVDLPVGWKVAGTRALMKQADGFFACCRKMPLEDVPSFVHEIRDKILLLDPLEIVDAGGEDKVAEDLRKRLGLDKEEPPAGGAAGHAGTPPVADAGPIESIDFRVLAVDFDEQGMRYKEFRAAVHESRDGSKYLDWPFQTESIAMTMVKRFERHGGNCLLWLDKWSSSHGIEPTERTAIEFGVHMRSIHYLATYDRINLGASAAAENILLRVAQIVQAYRSAPKRPNWAAVKHISGLDDAMDPLPSSLRTYNAKLAKEEVEAENLMMKTMPPSRSPQTRTGRPWAFQYADGPTQSSYRASEPPAWRHTWGPSAARDVDAFAVSERAR